MNKLVFKQSVILDDYESHKSLSFQFYGRSGVRIRHRQDEVNSKENGGNPSHYSSLIVSHLKNEEAIKLRDCLLAHYPLEAEEVQVNVNQYATFNLTDIGQQILASHDSDVKASNPHLADYSAGKFDKDGLCRMQLWRVMQVFGAHCGISAEPPFQDCLITIQGKGDLCFSEGGRKDGAK